MKVLKMEALSLIEERAILYSEELHKQYTSPNIIRMTKSKIRRAERVAHE
jgi:hypothetical protein